MRLASRSARKIAWVVTGVIVILIALISVYAWLRENVVFYESDPPRSLITVLDISGDGFQVSALDYSTAFFDLDGDLFAEQTEWIRPSDGILVLDRNGNGRIDGVAEIFGNAETSGFAELAELNSDDNDVVDSHDISFSNLRVWRDEDLDGRADHGELESLGKLGIESIDLDSERVKDNDVVDRVGTFARRDGTRGQIADLWLDYSQMNTIYRGDYSLSARIFTVPWVRGYGTHLDLNLAMSKDDILYEMVRDLASADPREAYTFESKVEAIIYRWSGVGDIPPDSRGPHVDAQHLAILEKLTDEPWINRYGSRYPLRIQGQILEEGYDKWFDWVLASLLVEGPFDDIFQGTWYDFFEDEFRGSWDFSHANRVFRELAPDDPEKVGAYWRTVHTVMRVMQKDMRGD
jgi:hypothetical protein